MLLPLEGLPRNLLRRYDYTLDTLRNQAFYSLYNKQQKFNHVGILVEIFNDLVHSMHLTHGDIEMAKKSFNGFTTKFAAIRLSQDDKKAFQKWATANKDDGDVYYVQLIQTGWKGSQRFDPENDCFVWSLTQTNEKDVNYDICVTSRSNNMYEAMLLGIYKLVIMYPEGRLPTEHERDNWG